MNILKIFNFEWIEHTLRKTLFIFIIGFCVYPVIEIIWNTILTPFGYKTFIGLFSMGILGGILLVILGNLNEIKIVRENFPPWIQALLGGIVITIMEFIFGLIFNILLHFDIWDYSNIPFNFMGQICLPYSLFWTVLSPLAFWLDDIFRLMYDKLCSRFNANAYCISDKHNLVRVDIGTMKDLKYRYKRFFKENPYLS